MGAEQVVVEASLEFVSVLLFNDLKNTVSVSSNICQTFPPKKASSIHWLLPANIKVAKGCHLICLFSFDWTLACFVELMIIHSFKKNPFSVSS